MDLPAVHNTINKAAQNITYSNILHRVVVVDSNMTLSNSLTFADFVLGLNLLLNVESFSKLCKTIICSRNFF